MLTLAVAVAVSLSSVQAPWAYTRPNPAIDPTGHQRLVAEAFRFREGRRLTEDQFLKLTAEPGTVVLDARSWANFARLHIRGAVNLPFPDIDIPTLARVLPDKTARILIYCNNNFLGVGPAARAMQPKSAALSLNLSTFPALYASGYRNLYELGPQLDPRATKLPLAGTDAGGR